MANDNRNKTVWQMVQVIVENHLGRDDEKNRPLIADLHRFVVETRR